MYNFYYYEDVQNQFERILIKIAFNIIGFYAGCFTIESPTLKLNNSGSQKNETSVKFIGENHKNLLQNVQNQVQMLSTGDVERCSHSTIDMDNLGGYGLVQY